MWRQGYKGYDEPINVYDGDRPVCQCHHEDDARRIVQAVNNLDGSKMLSELHLSCRAYTAITKTLHRSDAQVSDVLNMISVGRIPNFGEGSFKDLLVAMLKTGTMLETILASSLWNTAPHKWQLGVNLCSYIARYLTDEQKHLLKETTGGYGPASTHTDQLPEPSDFDYTGPTK